MAIQMPLPNAPGQANAWAPVSTLTIPLGPGGPLNPVSQGANPLMTELPPMPPPPFLNTSPAMAKSPAATAQTLPISKGVSSESVPEIPPPHMAAPWVFTRLPQPGVLRENNPIPSQPPLSQMPQPPQQQQPPESPQATEKKADQDKPDEPIDLSPLNDNVIRNLNDRLNSTVDDVRADAAIDFYKILDKNPGLADEAKYKPYIDAFLQKIMYDSNPAVRTAGELILQFNKVKEPNAAVKTRLQELASRQNGAHPCGIYNDPLDESATASSLLAQLHGAGTHRTENSVQKPAGGGSILSPLTPPPVLQPGRPGAMLRGPAAPGQPTDPAIAAMQTEPGGRLNLLSQNNQNADPFAAAENSAGQRMNLVQGGADHA